MRAKGFTMLELMLVTLIVALLAALVAPLLGPTARRAALRTGHYELVRLLRQARYTALATGRDCSVRLEPAPEGYTATVWLGGPESPGEPLDAEWAQPVQLPAIQRLMQVPPDRSAARRESLTIHFTPLGVAQDSVIELPGPAGRIEVRRPSGLVRLVGPDQASPAADDDLRAVQDYWQAHGQAVAP